MEGVAVANSIINNIIRGGKCIIHDKYVATEKVPPFVNSDTNLVSRETMMHIGNQAEVIKRNNYFSMQKDPMPNNITKDEYSIKATKIITQKNGKIK
jgi:hypothetical protein